MSEVVVGDKIIHKMHGLCDVKKVEECSLADENAEDVFCYFLKCASGGGWVYSNEVSYCFICFQPCFS